jgi:quercetin dioxygenase-like cupin family protein
VLWLQNSASLAEYWARRRIAAAVEWLEADALLVGSERLPWSIWACADAPSASVVPIASVRMECRVFTVELENERVRVLRIRYGPGEKSEMHSHPEGVLVFVTDAEARFTYPDGKTEDIRGKAGEVAPLPAMTHLPENLSDESFEVVLVELKG